MKLTSILEWIGRADKTDKKTHAPDLRAYRSSSIVSPPGTWKASSWRGFEGCFPATGELLDAIESTSVGGSGQRQLNQRGHQIADEPQLRREELLSDESEPGSLPDPTPKPCLVCRRPARPGNDCSTAMPTTHDVLDLSSRVGPDKGEPRFSR